MPAWRSRGAHQARIPLGGAILAVLVPLIVVPGLCLVFVHLLDEFYRSMAWAPTVDQGRRSTVAMLRDLGHMVFFAVWLVGFSPLLSWAGFVPLVPGVLLLHRRARAGWLSTVVLGIAIGAAIGVGMMIYEVLSSPFWSFRDMRRIGDFAPLMGAMGGLLAWLYWVTLRVFLPRAFVDPPGARTEPGTPD